MHISLQYSHEYIGLFCFTKWNCKIKYTKIFKQCSHDIPKSSRESQSWLHNNCACLSNITFTFVTIWPPPFVYGLWVCRSTTELCCCRNMFLRSLSNTVKAKRYWMSLLPFNSLQWEDVGILNNNRRASWVNRNNIVRGVECLPCLEDLTLLCRQMSIQLV